MDAVRRDPLLRRPARAARGCCRGGARRRRLVFQHPVAHHAADTLADAARDPSSARRHRLQALRPRLRTHFGGPGFDTTVAAFQVWRTALAQFDIGLASAQTIIFAILVSLVTLPLTWLHRYSEAHVG